MPKKGKLPYQELKRRLAILEAILNSLRHGQADAIISRYGVNLLRIRELEETLRRSEENFRGSMDTSPLGIRIVTETGETLYANRALLEIYGYETLEELQSTSTRERYTPQAYAEHLVRRHRRQRGEYVPPNYEISIIRKDGEVRHLEVFRKEVIWDGKRQFQVLYNDITERRLAEQALRESEIMYSALVNQSLDGIIIIQDEVIKFINRAFANMTGYREEELLGMPFQSVVAPEDRDWVTERHRRRMAGEAVPSVYETRLMCKDGTLLFVEVSAGLSEYQGRPANLTYLHNITKRKQTEEELKRSHEQLHNLARYIEDVRERERTRIARELHDEMAQSLTVLKMDLSWLDKALHQDQLSLREKVKSMSQLLDSTIKQTRRIVTELRPGVLDDLGLAAALEWQAGELQNHTGIACRVSVSPRNITINPAIATALFRIAQEALTNVVRHAQASRVEITLRKRGNRLLLRVKDNGRGITTEKLSDPNSLGLMGMRERLLHWNGEVKIRGVNGKGTTVTAIIPLS